MTSQEHPVERARQLVGVRFRPQGRCPAVGLDCVGLVCTAFDIPAGEVPCDNRLRGSQQDRLDAQLRRFFRRIAAAERAAGDVGLFQAGREQLHLAMFTWQGFIHADAKLRKIAECPADPPWPMLALYRRSTGRNERD